MHKYSGPKKGDSNKKVTRTDLCVRAYAMNYHVIHICHRVPRECFSFWATGPQGKTFPQDSVDVPDLTNVY